MSAATGDDRDLVEALRAGDEQAFAALIDGWSGSMLRMARLHVPTDSVAEEVVQETWLAVLTGLHRFRGDSSLRTWVYRILLNQAKTRGIRERRTVPFASLYDDDGNGGGPTVDPSRFQGAGDAHPGGWRRFPEEWPEQSLLSHEMHEVVARALEELPPRQRVVVALRDLDGHTADEVSELLTITAGNQRVLLHRGRAVVRAHLERYYETASLSGAGGDAVNCQAFVELVTAYLEGQLSAEDRADFEEHMRLCPGCDPTSTSSAPRSPCSASCPRSRSRPAPAAGCSTPSPTGAAASSIRKASGGTHASPAMTVWRATYVGRRSRGQGAGRRRRPDRA